MKIIDKIYFGNYLYFKQFQSNSFSSFYAAIMLFTVIGLFFGPGFTIIFGFIDDFIFNINDSIEKYIIGFFVLSWYFYCWFYFSYKKKAKKIIQEFESLDDENKTKYRKKAGRFIVLCFVLIFLQSIILLPLYTNWSFKKLGKKPWYEKVNYYDNTQK